MIRKLLNIVHFFLQKIIKHRAALFTTPFINIVHLSTPIKNVHHISELYLVYHTHVLDTDAECAQNIHRYAISHET